MVPSTLSHSHQVLALMSPWAKQEVSKQLVSTWAFENEAWSIVHWLQVVQANYPLKICVANTLI